MTSPRSILLALAALPVALSLAACGKTPDATAPAAAAAQALAKVPPPAGKAWSDVVAATPEGGYLMGNPAAPIKLLEYGSLSCPHCKKFSDDGFEKLRTNYIASGRVNYEYRSFAIHSIDVPMTMLVNCAPKESAFALVEQIYQNQDAIMTEAQAGEAQIAAAYKLPDNQRFFAIAQSLGLIEFFAQRGIAVDQAKSCLANVGAATAIAKHTDDYGKEGIDSTPTLLVNGANKIAGATFDQIEPILQNAGAR